MTQTEDDLSVYLGKTHISLTIYDAQQSRSKQKIIYLHFTLVEINTSPFFNVFSSLTVKSFSSPF